MEMIVVCDRIFPFLCRWLLHWYVSALAWVVVMVVAFPGLSAPGFPWALLALLPVGVVGLPMVCPSLLLVLSLGG